MKKIVLIYRDQLLPYSETFIPAQVASFTSYQGCYVGSSYLPSAKSMVLKENCLVLADEKPLPSLWKTAYKLAGVLHPNWLRRIEKLSPSLIHAHFGLDGVLALPLARKLGVPLVVTFHGYYATAEIEVSGKTWYDYGADFFQRRGQFFREFYGRRREILFREADCLIAVSQFIRSQLIEKGCPSDKVKVGYIGIDVDKFTPDSQVQRESTVLFVGRLVEKKGCEYLIRAMAEVQKIRPDVELVMIGDGSLHQSLETLAKKGLSRYRFLGVQAPETVKMWMNCASVLCAPSITTDRGETEGLPIVILEAMAMGLPVVSCRSAGIPEAVVDGETGFLVRERDWQNLAKCILTLIQDTQMREAFAIAARQRIEQRFSLQRNTACLEKVYTSILG